MNGVKPTTMALKPENLVEYHKELSALDPREQIGRMRAALQEDVTTILLAEETPAGLRHLFAQRVKEVAREGLTPLQEGSLLMFEGKSTEAKATFQQAYDAGDDSAILKIIEFSPGENSDDDQAQIAQLKSFLRKHPADSQAHSLLGSLYARSSETGDSDALARSHITQSMRLDQSSPNKHYCKGFLAFLANNIPLALGNYILGAEEGHSGSINSIIGLMPRLETNEEKQRATEALKKITRLGFIQLYAYIGGLQEEEKDFSEAAESFELALEAGNNHPQIYIHLLGIYGMQKEKELGFALLKKAAENEIQIPLGLILSFAIETNSQNDLLPEYLLQIPQNPMLHFAAMLLYLTMGDQMKTQEHLFSGIRENKLESSFRRMQQLQRQRKTDRALNILTEILKKIFGEDEVSTAMIQQSVQALALLSTPRPEFPH